MFCVVSEMPDILRVPKTGHCIIIDLHTRRHTPSSAPAPPFQVSKSATEQMIASTWRTACITDQRSWTACVTLINALDRRALVHVLVDK